MRIEFLDESVQVACLDPGPLNRAHGSGAARTLQRRLQQLQAMETLSDLHFLPCAVERHPDGHLELHVVEGLALKIGPDTPYTEGNVTMSRVKILGVVDTRTRVTAR